MTPLSTPALSSRPISPQLPLDVESIEVLSNEAANEAEAVNEANVKTSSEFPVAAASTADTQAEDRTGVPISIEVATQAMVMEPSDSANAESETSATSSSGTW